MVYKSKIRYLGIKLTQNKNKTWLEASTIVVILQEYMGEEQELNTRVLLA